jgi:error-prone DNA polymerase
LERSDQPSAVSCQPEGEFHHGGTEARSKEEGARDKGQVTSLEEGHQPSAISHQPEGTPLDQPSTINHQPSLRLGLRMISGLPLSAVQQIERVRQLGPFRSVDDFQLRTGLGRGVCQRLARADAFASLGIARRQALWQSLPDPESGTLFHSQMNEERPADLPSLTPAMEVTADYRTTGLSLRAHPFQFLRPQVAALRVVTAQSLEATPDGQRVKVAGLVLLRQRPGTAKGVTFVTLEDETGQVNLVVWQSVWEQFRRVARSASAMLVTGHLQKADGIIHVVAQRIQDLSELLTGIPPASRDFR